jgi:hypothetical protein
LFAVLLIVRVSYLSKLLIYQNNCTKQSTRFKNVKSG